MKDNNDLGRERCIAEICSKRLGDKRIQVTLPKFWYLTEKMNRHLHIGIYKFWKFIHTAKIGFVNK